MFDISDASRNKFMLDGPFANKGYDWWWHSFTAINETTGEEKPFFIEFFTCNPALGKDKPILGQLPQNKENHIYPSYLMVKVGCWGEDHVQLHRFFGWDDVKIGEGDYFEISAQDCFLSEFATSGSVCVLDSDAHEHPEWMSDAGEISWDLKIDKQVAFNVGYGASEPLRKAKAFEMYWHAEGMKTLYGGTIVYNNVRYLVKPESSYGYADKNWGHDFTSPWVWLSSCNLYSTLYERKLENSVFDIGGGRPKVYALPLDRKLLGAFYYEGEEFEFNFSKFWTAPKTKFGCVETPDEMVWKVWQKSNDAVMKVDVRCAKKDMLFVNYEAPNGEKRHNRLWNGGNGTGRVRLYRIVNGCLMLVDDMIASNVGCEFGVYDQE